MLHISRNVGSISAPAAIISRKFHCGYQDDALMCAEQAAQVQIDSLALYLHLDGVDFAMQNLCE
ncbi:hypothetical protein A8144_00095 [Mycobacterium leprae 3125609]|uniref:hypothetical protein n=1 Tax=Mycobacterium leprae TaxID=1769 RepID=UPI00059D1B36|nr:hypothetical protein [Mycobacterium leprae]OAR21665.1 hypothetical protein A8144_00095 [Mycobacterium leprae 3125609]OAX72204.1 hypothetical protein A3216_00155 [Mycobacterium leprae 7935681]